jgi:predicted P-loop ATPase/GTPase
MSDNKEKKVVRLTEEKMVDIIDKLATKEVEKRLSEIKRKEEATIVESEIAKLQAKLKTLNESASAGKGSK